MHCFVYKYNFQKKFLSLNKYLEKHHHQPFYIYFYNQHHLKNFLYKYFNKNYHFFQV